MTQYLLNSIYFFDANFFLKLHPGIYHEFHYESFNDKLNDSSKNLVLSSIDILNNFCVKSYINKKYL